MNIWNGEQVNATPPYEREFVEHSGADVYRTLRRTNHSIAAGSLLMVLMVWVRGTTELRWVEPRWALWNLERARSTLGVRRALIRTAFLNAAPWVCGCLEFWNVTYKTKHLRAHRYHGKRAGVRAGYV